MFWGLIMEPNKRYTQVVEKPFHISQSAMDISTGDNDPCQVMVMVDGKNFLICTLQKNKCIQTPLDLYFKSGDSISFLTNGKSNVHLTGYLDPEFEEEPSDDEEDEEEEEEVPKLVPAKNKRKVENSHDATPSKKAKPAKSKKAAAADSSDEDDEEDNDDQLQKLLDGDMDSDENDDSFKVNTSADDSDEDEEEDDDDEEEEEEAESEEDDDDEEEEESAPDTSKEEKELDTSKLSKSQRRRLKLKQKKQELKAKEPQVNGVDKKQEKKEKKEKKKEAQKEDAAVEKKEKKSLSGGIQIEDLKVGNGPAAKPGKTVMVYYEGRLKQNNKKFDDCVKGPGFKFRLGAKEVISGWDVGIAGMKTGGKRRIVCPPAMAYGAKGSPPVIPPNSTLVFEVELKEVK